MDGDGGVAVDGLVCGVEQGATGAVETVPGRDVLAVWSVPDFSECGLGCDSCECAMPFVPLGWGEVSQV